MPEEQAAPTRRGIDPSKFMGASFAAGNKLEKRVETNERKITILKNILKMRQQSDGKNKIGDTISGIAASVESISETVEDQNQFEEEKLEDERITAEQKGRKKREGFLEKMGGGIKKTAQKAIAPIVSIFDRIWNFIKLFALGAGVMKLIDWFSDPKNHKKVGSLIRFFKDWWPALLAGLIAFLPGLLGPAGVILGIIALAAWGIPKIIGAVKAIFGMNKDVDKIVDDSNKGLDKDIKEGDKIGGDKELDKMAADVEKQTTDTDVAPPEKTQQEEPQKFKEGGLVQGPGGVDKVPAKLTAGEFVMSKSAVKSFGENTFASMNASAGGTNIPVEHHYHSGGSGVERHYAGGGSVQPTGNNDNVAPPGTPTVTAQTVHLVPTDAGSSGGSSGTPQGTGSKVPSFSAIAPGGIAKEQTLGIRR